MDSALDAGHAFDGMHAPNDIGDHAIVVQKSVTINPRSPMLVGRAESPPTNNAPRRAGVASGGAIHSLSDRVQLSLNSFTGHRIGARCHLFCRLFRMSAARSRGALHFLATSSRGPASVRDQRQHSGGVMLAPYAVAGEARDGGASRSGNNRVGRLPC